MQIAHLYLKQSSSGSKVNWKATVTGNCHAGFGKGRFETCCKVTRGPPTSSGNARAAYFIVLCNIDLRIELPARFKLD